MNVFAAASGLLTSVIPKQMVLLRLRASAYNDATGVYEPHFTDMPVLAHVQYGASAVGKQTDTSIDSQDTATIWMSQRTPELVDFVQGVNVNNSQIIIGAKIYDCTDKRDWTLNGWLRLTGVYNGNFDPGAPITTA